MKRTKGNRTVRLSSEAVELLNDLCNRFQQSQTQMLDAAVRIVAKKYGNADELPIPQVAGGVHIGHAVNIQNNHGTVKTKTVNRGR